MRTGMGKASGKFAKFFMGMVAAGIAMTSWGADSERVYVVFKPGAKAAAKQMIQAARGQIHHEFDSLDAIATTLPAAALNGIRNNPNIDYVEEDPPRYLFGQQVPYGIGMVQATDVWDSDKNGIVDASAPTGAGIKVGVIDSGVYASHEDFMNVAMEGYDGNLVWNQDGLGHGTHVCGTLVAAMNDKGVVGVSPGTLKLYMVRVFGDDGAWAYSSTLLNAAQKCQAAGCKIISMSLGGARASRTEQQGLDVIYNNGKGVLLVAAAGNDGTTGTGYPAGYSSVISVAAIDSAKAVAPFSQHNSDVELCAPGVRVLSTVPYLEQNSVSVGGTTINGNWVEGAARTTWVSGDLVDGGSGDSVGAWSGKVVLVQRGTITFAQKVANVQAGGGVACVIYNNASGDFSGTLNGSSAIPAISVSEEAGKTLQAFLSSSASVVSLRQQPASGYAEYDGTSMATPHVSGVAALVWSAKSSASAGQIRSVLQSTAADLGAAGKDSYYGYGLVQAKAAIAALVGSGGGGGTTGLTIDLGPTATSVSAKRGTFKIAWTTNKPATSTVFFAGGSTTTDNTMVTSHAMTFQGTKGATYNYTVSSTDATGSTVTSAAFSFTVPK